MFQWTAADLEEIAFRPHILGHALGRDRLSYMHSSWIKSVWDSVHPNKMTSIQTFQAHRGSYKTTAFTEIGIIRWLLFHPNDRIALVRKPFRDAAKTAATIKKFFEGDIIQSLFHFAHGKCPKFVHARDTSYLFNFKKSITKESSLDVFGLDGGMTGYHYDIIVVDDFVTLKDRLSRAERESTKEYVQEIITNVIDPGKKCIFIGTPWHKHDAWEILPAPQKFTVYDTGILTPEEIEFKRKTTTTTLFTANYELTHIGADDREFGDPTFAPWDFKVYPVYMHIDAKYSGDHTGAVTVAARKPNGRIQMRGWVFTEHVKERMEWIKTVCKKYRVQKIYLETNPDKGYLSNELQAAGMRTEPYAETMNKHNKICSFLKGAWSEIDWAEDCDEAYLEQILDYIEGQKPDDAPDGAASMVCRAFKKRIDNSILYKW